MEISRTPTSKKSPSLSPISAYKKKYPRDVLNMNRFKPELLDNYMPKEKNIEVTLKLENGKSLKKKYRIVDKLGEGKYGYTYIALDIDEKKLYVIKFQTKQSAQNEIKCLQAVKPICGEYILCYVGHFDYILGTSVFGGIVTDYEENFVALNQYLFDRQKNKGQDLTLDEKEDIIKNVRIGMDRLSKLGIIHNDLHYGNLLWNIGNGPKKGIIKIIDFGLCKFEPNVLNAKRKNDEWIDQLSKSLNIFLSKSDMIKINSHSDPRIRELLNLLRKSNSPKTEAPVESEEDSLSKRMKKSGDGIISPKKEKEDSLIEKIRTLKIPVESEEDPLIRRMKKLGDWIIPSKKEKEPSVESEEDLLIKRMKKLGIPIIPSKEEKETPVESEEDLLIKRMKKLGIPIIPSKEVGTPFFDIRSPEISKESPTSKIKKSPSRSRSPSPSRSPSRSRSRSPSRSRSRS